MSSFNTHIGSNSPTARISTMFKASGKRFLASATALPTWPNSYPAILGPDDALESSDPAVTGYRIIVKRGGAPAAAIRFCVGDATDAANKHAKWRIAGIRQRPSAFDSNNPNVLLSELVPLVEVGVFGGPIVVNTLDDLRPKNVSTGTATPYSGAAAQSLKWADRIVIAEGEQYVSDDAIQILAVTGGVAELQINTMGCSHLILIPACLDSDDPGSDAAANTGAALGDL